ncbi:MAG TPA: DUF1398 family protein [Rhabdochlamydiaceae bacterium]|nr:DUF1398 family protein [Rhabdochlamydiaceae bacterium]
MNPKIIEECKSLSLAAKIKFPEVVKRLQAERVERYLCDLVGLKVHYFSINGEVYTLSLAYKAAPVALRFDAAAVKKSVASSQKGEITYVQFLDQIIAAGCTHYEVYITGKKVIYFGRDGSQHIELFPGVRD